MNRKAENSRTADTLGCEIYTVKAGDTLYRISKQYDTTLDAIFTANPGINPICINDGQKIIIPSGSGVVAADGDYDFASMKHDIFGLKARYPFLEARPAGQSVMKRDIYYIRLGTGKKEILINGSHHGSEWITSVILMKYAEDFLNAYAHNTFLGSCRPIDIWNEVSVYIIPMVNPDGVDIAVNGIQKDNPYYRKVMEWGRGGILSKWDSNIRGVDLNHNYDAGWDISKKREKMYGIYGPGPVRYCGPYPESEPETLALTNFTRKHSFDFSVSYHAGSGRVLWTYNRDYIEKSEKTAQVFAALSGYSIVEPGGLISYSGFKEWFIKEFKRPSYVIEVDSKSVTDFDRVYKSNLENLILASIL